MEAARTFSTIEQQQQASVLLVTGGYDHTVRFWEASTGLCYKSLQFTESAVNKISISPDRSKVAVAGNPIVKIFDTSSNQQQPILTLSGHKSNVVAMEHHPENRWIYTGSEDGTVRLWDMRSSNHQSVFNVGKPVQAAALHPAGNVIITADRSGCIKFWDLRADQCARELLPDGVGMFSICVRPDGQRIAAANKDGIVYVWSAQSDDEEPVPMNKIRAHNGFIPKICWSPDCSTVSTCAEDGTIKLWDGDMNSVTKTLTGHQRWVWDCGFSGDSQFLFSASSDQSVRLWSMQTAEVVRMFGGHTKAVTAIAVADSAA